MGSYAVLNLYTGVRDSQGRWDVTLFAKNVFDKKIIVDQSSARLSTGLTTLTFGPGGRPTGSVSSWFASLYHTVNVLEERELGVSVRVGLERAEW